MSAWYTTTGLWVRSRLGLWLNHVWNLIRSYIVVLLTCIASHYIWASIWNALSIWQKVLLSCLCHYKTHASDPSIGITILVLYWAIALVNYAGLHYARVCIRRLPSEHTAIIQAVGYQSSILFGIIWIGFNTLVPFVFLVHICLLVICNDSLISSKYCLVLKLNHIYLLLMAFNIARWWDTEHCLLQRLWLAVLKQLSVRILHVLDLHLWALWNHDLFLGRRIGDYQLYLCAEILQNLSGLRLICWSICLLQSWMKLLLVLLWLRWRHLNILKCPTTGILSIDRSRLKLLLLVD